MRVHSFAVIEYFKGRDFEREKTMQPDIFRTLLGACIIAAGLTSASVIDRRYIQHRDALDHNVFEHGATGAKLSFVKNSGICETTAGVNQYSGYLSVGENLNMWFW